MTELTVITIYGNGRRDPHIPFGTPVLLIQGPVANPGRIMCEPDDERSVYVDYPKNVEDLLIRATEIVKQNKPEYLESENHLVVTCPSEIADKMVWE